MVYSDSREVSVLVDFLKGALKNITLSLALQLVN